MSEKVGAGLTANIREGMRTGIEGWLDDDLVFVSPWGFEPGDSQTPTFIWHGGDDRMVPFAHGKWLATRMPSATVHLRQGAGHLSIAVNALDRTIDELSSAL